MKYLSLRNLSAVVACSITGYCFFVYFEKNEEDTAPLVVLKQHEPVSRMRSDRNREVIRNTGAVPSGKNPETGRNLLSRRNSIELALAEKDFVVRERLLGEIAREWAKEDPDACFEWANSLSLPCDKSVAIVNTLLVVLDGGNGDLSKALLMIDKIGNGETKDDAIVYSFSAIVSMDRSRALSLVSSLSSKGAVSAVADRLGANLAERESPDEVSRLCADMPYGLFRNELHLSYIKHIAKLGPEKSLDWLQQNMDFDGVEDAYSLTALAYAHADPERGLKDAWLITDKNMRENFMSQIGIEWAKGNAFRES